MSYRGKDGKREVRVEEVSSSSTMEDIKSGLQRKLSQRSSIRELLEKRILHFEDNVKVVEVPGNDEYDRK